MSDHLLPPNASAEEKAVSTAMARISDVPVPLRELWNPETCPVDLLPWLAWALSVDVWDADWPEEVKRRAIGAAIAVHRRKGTPWAVEEAFRALGIQIEIAEWFEYGGEPYTFRLNVEAQALNAGTYETIGQVVERTRNVRSHLDALEIIVESSGGMVLSCGACRLTPPVRAEIDVACTGASALHSSGVCHVLHPITIQ